MDGYLRWKTSCNVSFGPTKDKSNAVSAETTTPSVALTKNGAAFVARAAGGTVTHLQFGYWRCPLNSVDTNTLGRLRITGDAPATFLPVFHSFVVVPSNVYDSLIGGTQMQQVDLRKVAGVTHVLHEGIASGVGLTQISLAASANANNGFYRDCVVRLISAAAGSFQYRHITAYSGAAKRITFSPAHAVQPSGGTMRYQILPKTRDEVAGTLSKLDDLTIPTVGQIADAVWDEVMSGHVVDGTFGNILNSNATKKVVESARASLNTAIGTRATPANVESARASLNTAVGTRAAPSHVESARASLNTAVGTRATPANVESARASLNTAVGTRATPANVESARASLSTALATKPTAAQAADAVWDEVLSGHLTPGTTGAALSVATVGGSATVGSPTQSAIATKVWDRLRSLHTASGSFGKGVGQIVGAGDVPVDHNFGSTDALRIVDSGGSGVADAEIRAFLKSDWDSGNRNATKIKGLTSTKDDGRWRYPLYLSDNVAYVLQITGNGIAEKTTEVTP